MGCWWRGGGASFEKVASELRLKCGEGAGCVGLVEGWGGGNIPV